jgi:hypothetical protein
MPRRHTTARTAARLTLLAVALLALPLALVAPGRGGEKAGDGKAGPDLATPRKLLEWVEKDQAEIDKLRADGFILKADRRRDELQKKLDALKGKKISWELRIKSLGTTALSFEQEIADSMASPYYAIEMHPAGTKTKSTSFSLPKEDWVLEVRAKDRVRLTATVEHLFLFPEGTGKQRHHVLHIFVSAEKITQK